MGVLSLHSPLGDLTIASDGAAIVALDWGRGSLHDPDSLCLEAKRQLDAYFDGTLERFNLPLAPFGTTYQQKVWGAMRDIPYGHSETYGALAARIGSVARAVGMACGANPIPIIIPCHRVTAANGKLGGYSGDGGDETKRQLLILEGAQGLLF